MSKTACLNIWPTKFSSDRPHFGDPWLPTASQVEAQEFPLPAPQLTRFQPMRACRAVPRRLFSVAATCFTRSPAVARDGRPYWPSRKNVIPSGIRLAAVLAVGQLFWLVKLIVHLLIAYCPSTLYRATLAVINNACLLTCDTSRTNSDQHPQFICICRSLQFRT